MVSNTLPRRVLILVENMSVPTDRRVWKEAAALTRAGYLVTVICPAGVTRDTSVREEIDGVTIHRYPQREAGGSPRSYALEYFSALVHMRRLARRAAKSAPFDVVQICNPPDILHHAVRSLRRGGAALVFDHHDLVPELFEVRFGGRGGMLLKAALAAERGTFRRADIVLSPNESYRSIAIERGGKAPEDVVVVRMAPDAERFTPREPDPALKRGSPFLIAYAGTIGAQDGVDHAVRALRILADRRQDWRAIFAGSGDALTATQALATELGLDDRVEFVGFLEDDELVTLLSSADVCLAPEPRNALNEASTMIKVVEYLGLGRPVVAYDIHETRFSAGEAALYATPNDETEFADCIERLLDDSELRRRMGAAGRARVMGELSWARSEEALLNAYERALAKRDQPASNR